MRFKSLFLILYFVLCNSSFAQITGFIDIDLYKGFNLISNQLDNNKTNFVVDIFESKFDEGVIIYKYTNNVYEILAYEPDWGMWIGDTNMTAAPGEGLFIYCLTNKTVTITGKVITGLQILNIREGFSIFSSIAPINTDLSKPKINWPVENGDIYYEWDGINQSYKITSYEFDEWAPYPLTLKVGEAVWVYKMSSNTWERDFSPPPNKY